MAAVVVISTKRTEKQAAVRSLVQAVEEAERALVLIQQTVGLAVPGAVML